MVVYINKHSFGRHVPLGLAIHVLCHRTVCDVDRRVVYLHYLNENDLALLMGHIYHYVQLYLTIILRHHRKRAPNCPICIGILAYIWGFHK